MVYYIPCLFEYPLDTRDLQLEWSPIGDYSTYEHMVEWVGTATDQIIQHRSRDRLHSSVACLRLHKHSCVGIKVREANGRDKVHDMSDLESVWRSIKPPHMRRGLPIGGPLSIKVSTTEVDTGDSTYVWLKAQVGQLLRQNVPMRA